MNTLFSKEMTLPMVMRRVGTIVLLVAGASFLFEGWHKLTSIDRYFYFLCFSLVLTGIGFYCGRFLGESKGARTFLGLATATLAAHFAQLGSAIYTAVGGSASVQTIVGTLPVSILATIGVLITIPIAFVGFAALQRTEAIQLSATYLVFNALLLIPIRTGAFAAAIIAASTVLFLFFDHKNFAGKISTGTLEGLVSRLLVFSPLAVMLVRAALYPMTPVMAGTMLWIFSSILFFYLPSIPAATPHKGALQNLSLPFYFWGWLEFATAIDRTVLVPVPFDALFYMLPCCVLLFALSSFVEPTFGRAYRALSSYAAIIVLLASFALNAPVAASLFAVTTGVLLIFSAFTMKERHCLTSGFIGVGMGLGYHIVASLEFWMRAPWISLGCLGMGILLIAVYLEKNEAAMVMRWKTARERFATWR